MKEQFQNKLVIAVRSDLKLSPGKLAVQVAHASVSCALETKSKKGRWFKDWYREGQKKVVVKVADKEALFELLAFASELGIIASLIKDAGLTEIDPGTVTCLGIGPAPVVEIDKVTGALPLL
ncbi:MAG: peptidyl-tRNA hydrolase Pth2 [Candidatus Thermoplasmatota archaeon]|nr:peptidyl-tRNA hydrolase Pth2 [Candidatus Thermoplasmatota archaeon]